MGKKSLILFTGLCLILATLLGAQPVRKPVWAGKFYPDDPFQLRQMLAQWLRESSVREEIKNLNRSGDIFLRLNVVTSFPSLGDKAKKLS